MTYAFKLNGRFELQRHVHVCDHALAREGGRGEHARTCLDAPNFLHGIFLDHRTKKSIEKLQSAKERTEDSVLMVGEIPALHPPLLPLHHPPHQ